MNEPDKTATHQPDANAALAKRGRYRGERVLGKRGC